MKTVAEILAQAKANQGKMPPVNPPEAAAVLETKTAVEVEGGTPEELPPPVVPSPVEKPEDVKAAEAAPKTRRTAAVVQKELDEALERIAELESGGTSVDGGLAAQLKTAEDNLAEQCRANDALIQQSERHKNEIQKLKEHLEARETLIKDEEESSATLQAELSNAQATVLELTTALESALEGQAAPVGVESSNEELIKALNARGLTLTVTYPGAA